MTDDRQSNEQRESRWGWAICPQCERVGMFYESWVDEQTIERVYRWTCPGCGHVHESRR